MVVKRCSCGLEHDHAGWGLLDYVGPMDDGDGKLLMLRNCRCGSTIAIYLDELVTVRSSAPTLLPPPPLG